MAYLVRGPEGEYYGRYATRPDISRFPLYSVLEIEAPNSFHLTMDGLVQIKTQVGSDLKLANAFLTDPGLSVLESLALLFLGGYIWKGRHDWVGWAAGAFSLYGGYNFLAKVLALMGEPTVAYRAEKPDFEA